MPEQSSGPGVPARALVLQSEAEVAAELRRLGVHPAAVALMAPKGMHLNIMVQGIPGRAAQVLKQEALAEGAEAAIPWQAGESPEQAFPALLMGTREQLLALQRRLEPQPLGLARVGAQVGQAIARAERTRSWQIDLPDGRAVVGGKRTLVMGIINLTDDSFSGDGIGREPEAAARLAREMAEAGADLLDLGAESTRPGAEPVDGEDEINRLLPCLEAVLAATDLPISVDTYKPHVARSALGAGASIINDITALSNPDMAALAAEWQAPVILMHMQGTPKTMQQAPHYDDLLGEVFAFLARALQRAVAAGIPDSQVILDPGFGFGKTLDHNLELLRRLAELRSLGCPLLVGTSRKSTIGTLLGGLPPQQRVEGTAATVALAIANGADIVRVHDVREMVRVARVTDAVVRGWRP